jgi:hypothetical protein
MKEVQALFALLAMRAALHVHRRTRCRAAEGGGGGRGGACVVADVVFVITLRLRVAAEFYWLL